MNLNQIILIGRITTDLDLKKTKTGRDVLSFGLATNKKWTDKDTGKKMENTQFHRIVMWGINAVNIAEYAKKGDEILIEGYLMNREYEKDGIKHKITEIVASKFQFGQKKIEKKVGDFDDDLKDGIDDLNPEDLPF